MSSPNVNTSVNTYVPGIYIDENTSNAITGLVATTEKVLIIGQKTSSGIASDATPVQVFSEADAILQFGAGSVAHQMVKSALIANPGVGSNLWVSAMSDAGGSADATGSITLTTATAAGQINTWLGDYNVQYNYSSGDTSVAIAAGLGQAIKNATGNILVTCDTSASALVHLTAVNKGTLGNDIAVSCTATPGTGVIPVIEALSGGATDPTIGPYSTVGTLLANIVNGQFTIIVSAFSDSTRLGQIKDFLNFVSGVYEQHPATAYFGYSDLVGTLTTGAYAIASGLNSGRMSMAYQSYSTGQLAKTPMFMSASAYASIIASQTDPAAPYDNYAIPGVFPPSIPDRLSQTMLNSALHHGIAPLKVNPGEIVSICRAVSTYTLNSSGYPDPTLLDITTIRALDYVRFQVSARLAPMMLGAKNSAAFRARIKASIISVLYEMESLQIVQNVNTYKAGIIVENDLTNLGQINVKIPTNLVYGAHVIAGYIDLIL